MAERLGAHESQVSRDERNEYHGVTVERASRILDALGVRFRSEIEQPIARGWERSSKGAGCRSSRAR
jgi:hypothetical protein